MKIYLFPGAVTLLVLTHTAEGAGSGGFHCDNCRFNDIHVVLEQIPKDTLEISIVDNNIPEIPTLGFVNISLCVELNLARNRITVIGSHAFQGMVSLERLLLNENELGLIVPSTFDGLGSLKELDLSGNKLKELTSDTFKGIPNLEILHLSENEISRVNSGTFDEVRNLKELYLGNSKLTTVTAALFAKVSRPLMLDISGNPLNCDSNLCWLKQEVDAGCIKWMNETEENQRLPVGHVYKPSCADGTNWNDITWDCDKGTKFKKHFMIQDLNSFQL